MTYAGLKSFLYAGVGKDDPRVKAAIEWISRHYTLDENPGHGPGRACSTTTTPSPRRWTPWARTSSWTRRASSTTGGRSCSTTLKKKQKADGSWANTNGAFLENTPELATAFAVLALSYTTKK